MTRRTLTPAELDQLQQDPIRISIVGPANHGKTCVTRTLTEDATFGIVQNFGGSTVRPQSKKRRLFGSVCLEIYDTPGFQMSEEIYEQVHERKEDFRLEHIIAVCKEEGEPYRHDLLAWEQIQKSEVMLYVIDVFERPKTRYRCDVKLLLACRIPFIPVYNFLPEEKRKNGHYLAEWQEFFIDHNQHLDCVYDAFQRNLEHERKVLEAIAFFLRKNPLKETAMHVLLESKESKERQRLEEAARALARLLLDAATYREERLDVRKEERKQAAAEVQAKMLLALREREHRAQVEIIEQWGYEEDALQNSAVMADSHVDSHRNWLGKEVLSHFGLSSARGAAIGTAVGFVVDLATGGTLIGLPTFVGTAIGTAFGAGYAGVLEYQYDENDWKVTGRIDRGIITVLLCRNLDLIDRVRRHGKGRDEDIKVSRTPPKVDDREIWEALQEHRHQKSLSTLNGPLPEAAADRRERVVEQLVDLLWPLVEGADESVME